MSKISILIADDHKIVRMGLKSLFAAEKDLTVVGEADDGDVTIRQALKLKPDIIIMDLMMPKMDGVAATAEIHTKLPNTKIVVLTSYSTSDTIAAALAAGASGAVMKSADDSTLLTAVRTVAAGRRFISPEVKGLLAFDPPAPTLSPRQASTTRRSPRSSASARPSRRSTSRPCSSSSTPPTAPRPSP